MVTALLSTLTFICLIQASSGQKNLMENLTHRDVYLSRFSEGFFCFDIALYSLIYIGSHNLASPWQAVHNQHKNIVSVQNQNKLLMRIVKRGVLVSEDFNFQGHQLISNSDTLDSSSSMMCKGGFVCLLFFLCVLFYSN